ncbi:MAG: putative rane protein [Herbinix sp.]|jgi:ABC-2 type transport system permease protein|nr:putative rane protein [Herbinix sp.]
MKNLLRSDFYKLFKSKTFYICALVASVLSAASIFILKWANSVMQSQGVVEDPATGAVINVLPYKDGLSFGIAVFSDNTIPLFIGIIISILLSAEFTHGTMKNVVSKGFARHKVYLSKFLTMVTAAVIFMIIVSIVATLSASIALGAFGTLSGTLLLQLIRVWGIEILLVSAFVSVFVMVAMVVRNNGGVIAINICLLLFANLVYSLLELIFRHKIPFSDYSLLVNMASMANFQPEGEVIVRAIIVGVCFLAVSLFIGLSMFRKVDVK